MLYIPKYFKAYELLPREYYYRWEDRGDLIWFLFDQRILITADLLRERYGKMIANTWYWGGEHSLRGWRPMDTLLGAELSQHKWGRALDLVPQEITAEEIRQDIKSNPQDSTFKLINAIEEDIAWFHYDVRNWLAPVYGILWFGP